MGSYSPPPLTSSLPSDTFLPSRKSIHVLVTGFGPFHTIRLNPSHLVALALPPTLTTPHHDIHIHAHPAPIPVSYKYVREVVPTLLFPPSPSPPPHPPPSAIRPLLTGEDEAKSAGRAVSPRPSRPAPHPTDRKPEQQTEPPLYDLTLFIGVAPKRKDYSLESRARRDGYEGLDGDGKRVGKYAFPTGEAVPEVLETGVDVRAVVERWRDGITTPAPTLSLSKDAGRYLCEFIYYTGLWEHYKRDPPPEVTRKHLLRKRPVLFLHVPGGAEAADIALGARVAEGLIAAVVGRWEEEDKGLYRGQLEGFGGGRGKEGNEKWVEGGTLGDAEGKGWEGS